MHLKSLLVTSFICGLAGCAHENRQIVSGVFIDSLIKNYREPEIASSNDSNIIFWQNRIRPELPGLVSESKFAAALAFRFHLFGDISDIRTAEQVNLKIDSDFNGKEAQVALTLARYSILQHRFREADDWLVKARQTGLKKYDELTAGFDVDFELGRYFNASNELKELKSNADYGYFFRRSKMDHLNGQLDSSIHAMMRAAELEENSPYLKQVALGNAADLHIHAGELERAAALYQQCVQMNGADFHSLLGLGWIALVHDQNDSLAEKIFSFVRSKNKLPDALYKLNQMADARGDRALENKFAEAFNRQAGDPAYGRMYNKYLIELNTGILHNPAVAEQIAEGELDNRATPQTYAWYAWSLFSNNKKDKAYTVFEKNVSGRPLEGLELYWMGKMMQGLNKGFNARAFYEAAWLNKFDLSPGIRKDLEKQLD
jgi:hypothetical protein